MYPWSAVGLNADGLVPRIDTFAASRETAEFFSCEDDHTMPALYNNQCGQPITVLLMSADRGLLRCLGKLLEICGCEVCPVGEFQQATAALASLSPDFLILDAESGLDEALNFSRAQSARRARGEVYTLLLTHSAEVHELYKALEAGVDDFLAKPVVYCELLARIRAGARELELERRLGEQSGIDPMSGLANRRAFESRLGRQLAAGTVYSGSAAACVLMEIDFFRRINHQLGRRAREAVLANIAAKLRELAGDAVFLACVGPGRFAFLPPLVPTSPDKSGTSGRKMTDVEATAWAEGLRQQWAEAEIVAGKRQLQFTASFGVAVSDEPNHPPGGHHVPMVAGFNAAGHVPRVVTHPATAARAASHPKAGSSITAAEVLRRSAAALDLAMASGGNCVLRYLQLDDQDEALSSFAAPGRLFEGAFARDVMTPLPGLLRTEDLAGEALQLLRRCRLAALPVVDKDGKLLGVLTEDCTTDDLTPRGAAFVTVGQVMNDEVACLDENASFTELVEGFAQDAAATIVITHNGRPTGLATPENLVVLGRTLTRENLMATAAYSPLSDYLIIPDHSPAETVPAATT
jgi:two-component system, cell cycle response regulator